MINPISPKLLALLLAVLTTNLNAADLLVAMSGGGTVERYESATGRHVGTFINRIDQPNALAYGPDGALDVATGTVGGAGAVKKFNGVTGRFLGNFISVPAGQPGYLARASDIVWHEGDCFVVSCDDSKVHRYDGKTGAFKGTVATGNPKGWITQIAVRDGAVFTTEFSEARVRRCPLADGEPAVFVEQAGFTPWGIAFDQGGHCWWSGSGGIARFDGKTNAVVVPAGEVTTPVALAVSPDGQLVCSSNGRQSVTTWDISEEAPKLLRTITGPEVRDPAGVAFTTQPFEAPAQFGNFEPQPSNTGRDWTPTGTTIYNLRADATFPVVTEFGIDTEGGDRAKTQLLREPMRLIFTLADGRTVDAWDVPAKRQLQSGKVEYRFSPAAGIDARWSVWLAGESLRMSLALDGEKAGQVTKAELLIPFDPRAMGTTILAEEWGVDGAVKAPLIISALDMGQLRLSGAGSDEALACRFTGSRLHKRIDLRVEFPGAGKGSIVFEPARLEKPNAAIPDAEWAKVRRGLISLLQITPFMPLQEDGSPWLGSPGGITGNNVISDPVSVTMDRNLQWLNGMGDKAVLMGIDLNKIARKTIEFWLNQRMNDDGSLDYVLQKGNISADSNTGVLNAATDYYLSTGDKSFVSANKDALVKAVGYLIARDLDDDGLIETFRDGNGRNQFGDTGYDTVSSGWKNALVNGQAYKSFLGVAKMMEDIGADQRAREYRQRAVRLRRAYNKTFFLPDKKRYLWWIGQDGTKHDYHNTLVQENAVIFGIADCIELDAGFKYGSRDVMEALWNALDAVEYRDSAKGKAVDYIDAKSGSYTGFYWGIPNNLEDVPDAFNFSNYGNYEFPYYCNGGIFPLDTVAAIMAFSSAGMKDKADIIRREIFRRQHEGILPNGSGFYMGVVNIPGQCYSILKWDGTPTDYEGIISRDCSFLQTAILVDDPARELFQQAAAQKP
jgi:WD40 repeat protein